MTLDDFTLLPGDWKNKDPRGLPVLYKTSLNVVSFCKQMQKFSFYQALQVAEDMAKKQGFILLPHSCIHWERAKKYGEERKVKIGRKSFFLMKISELTEKEMEKLQAHLEDLKQ